MIDVKELRIGNYIIEEDGCFAKVIGFNPHSHSVRCDEEEGCEILVDIYEADSKIKKGYISDSQKSRPIELTPELLQKCGAKFCGQTEDIYQLFLDGESEWLIIGKMKKDHYFNMWELHFLDNEGEKSFPYTFRQFKYLHEIQNLYYVLTGRELQINL